MRCHARGAFFEVGSAKSVILLSAGQVTHCGGAIKPGRVV
jgi:hypothetical protein